MIINCYLPRDVNPTGFGDFLRGCVSCHQFAIEHGFNFDIHLGHWSSYFQSELEDPPSNIHVHDLVNRCACFNEFEMYLNRIIGLNKVRDVYICTNMWPKSSSESFFSYSIDAIPTSWGDISSATREFLKSRLLPTDKLLVGFTPLDFEYEVVHVRLPDSHTFGGKYTEVEFPLSGHYASIFRKVMGIQRESSSRILILTNSKNFRLSMQRAVIESDLGDVILFSDVTPTHSGVLSDAGTMHDLLKMTEASVIHQLSVYPWGSGFSRLAHHIYGVPLKTYSIYAYQSFP